MGQRGGNNISMKAMRSKQVHHTCISRTITTKSTSGLRKAASFSAFGHYLSEQMAPLRPEVPPSLIFYLRELSELWVIAIVCQTSIVGS